MKKLKLRRFKARIKLARIKSKHTIKNALKWMFGRRIEHVSNVRRLRSTFFMMSFTDFLKFECNG